jgi:hypothetical protein
MVGAVSMTHIRISKASKNLLKVKLLSCVAVLTRQSLPAAAE